MDPFNMNIAQPRNALPHQNMNPEQVRLAHVSGNRLIR